MTWNMFRDKTGTLHGFKGTAFLKCVSCGTRDPKDFIIGISYLWCAECDKK